MEVVYADITGQTTYGMIFRMSDGFVWDTVAAAFEAYAGAGIADYDVAGVEKGASGIYSLTFPAAITVSGGHKVIIKRRVGGAPAESDPIIWEEAVWWTGTLAGPPPPPSSSPEQVTGYFYTYDPAGAIEEDVEIHSYAKDIIALTDDEAEVQIGYALDTTIRTVISDADGLVEFPGLFKGVTYSFKRGTSGSEYQITIPVDAADPYELPSILGMP